MVGTVGYEPTNRGTNAFSTTLIDHKKKDVHFDQGPAGTDTQKSPHPDSRRTGTPEARFRSSEASSYVSAFGLTGK